MKGPNPNSDVDDRILECQEDIEETFIALLYRAQEVGWKEAEVCLALTELADNRLLGTQANEVTQALIRRLLERRRRGGG